MNKTAICIGLLLRCQVWALSCTTPVTLSQPGQEVSWPKVAMNEEGEVLVSWIKIDPHGESNVVVFATRDAEKKWSSSVSLESAESFSERKLFIDDKGNNFAFWKIENEDEEGEKKRFYQFAKQEKHNVWSSIVNVLGPEDPLKYPRYVFDSEGNIRMVGTVLVEDLKETWKTKSSVVAWDYFPKRDEKKQTEISKLNGGWINSEHLFRNKEGDVFALWREETSTYSLKKGYQYERNLKGVWLQDDATWSVPVTISSHLSGNYLWLVAVMNSKKEMALLWQSDSGANALKKICVLTYFNDQWSEPLDLAENKESDPLKISMNGQGDIVACWTMTEKRKDIICVADKPRGETWSVPIVLSSPAKDISGVKVAMDHQGNTLMMWLAEEGKNEVCYVAGKSKGQPWSSPVALSDPTKNAYNNQLSMDDKGNALVTWTVLEKRKRVPYAAYKPANQDWLAPVRLADGTRGYMDLKLTTNNLGCFIVLWTELKDELRSIHGASFSTENQQWASCMISPEGQDCVDFTFKFNKKGQGIITWETEEDDSSIQVAELSVN